jgi:hypothetical protein
MRWQRPSEGEFSKKVIPYAWPTRKIKKKTQTMLCRTVKIFNFEQEKLDDFYILLIPPENLCENICRIET